MGKEVEIFEGRDVYTEDYTYEHLKVACVVQDYINNYIQGIDVVYEDIAKITLEIYDAWLEEEQNETLSSEEYAYIQAYAYRYLKEDFEW
jgi:hypothetical protein